jgi:hypothetical protein
MYNTHWLEKNNLFAASKRGKNMFFLDDAPAPAAAAAGAAE